uniref:Uncharacterized protein n=1 Tax=Tanacetum cinerariifolium TaxID=118510 RepID=A0A699KRP5_TANCI|nr:hypothetical protein [Tanacetum cinerariifolium]
MQVGRALKILLPEKQIVTDSSKMVSDKIQFVLSRFFTTSVGIKKPKFLIKMSQRRSEGEESEYAFFEGDGLSSDEWGDYGVAGDDYECSLVFDDDQYEEKIVSGDVGK